MDPDCFTTCAACGEQTRATSMECGYCGALLTVVEEEAQPMVEASETVQQCSAESSPQGASEIPPLLGTPEGSEPQMRSGLEIPPIIEAPRRNYLVRHWRGDLSLGISYWVNGLLVTLGIVAAANTLAAVEKFISLKLVSCLMILLYATAVGASLWQLVGIWRSASRHCSRGGRSLWATLAKVAVILGLVRCAAAVITTYIPQTIEMASVVAGDTKVPAFEIRVLPGETEMEFRGGLRAGCASEFEKALAAAPGVKVLHINSIGGRLSEARTMMRLVRERGLTTYTSEQCLSAATLVLVSGVERVVAAGAEVGFHAGRLPGATFHQQRAMDDLVRKAMESAGVSEDFIRRVLATPSDDMWYPSVAEMQKHGVVTSQSYGDRFAASWAMPNERLLQELDRLPCFRTIREFEPEAYAKMMTNFTAAVGAGKSEGEAIAVVSQAATSLMEKYLPAASDEALLALRDQWIEILIRYKDTRSEACVAVFTEAKINYSRAFPDWNMTNTLVVIEKVIRSGSSKATVSVNLGAARDDLQRVYKPLETVYGDDLLLLQKQDEWRTHSRKVCDMLLALYQEIERLPDKGEANLIRFLVTSKE